MAKKPEFIKSQKEAEAAKQAVTGETASILLAMQMAKADKAEAQRQKELREKREAEEIEATMKFLEEERAEAQRQKELRQKRDAEEAEKIARDFEAQERAERQRKEDESFKKFMDEEAAKEAAKKDQVKRETEEVARRFEVQEKAEIQRKEKEAEEILYLAQSKVYMDEFIRKEMNTLAEVSTKKALKWSTFTQASSGSSSSSSASPSKSSGVKISSNGQEVLNLLQDSLGSFTKGSLVGMGYSIDAIDEALKALGDNNVIALTDDFS